MNKVRGMAKNIIAAYEKLKVIADKEFIAKSYNNALKCVSVAAGIANYYNFRYEDNELEALCKSIGMVFLEKKSDDLKSSPDLDSFKNKIVFYDCFAYDSRGLTQQYIRALKSAKLPFVFILNSDQPLTRNTEIRNELLSYEFAKIIDISKINTPEDKLVELTAIVKMLTPRHVFLHMKPNDAVGVAAWSNYVNAERYQINLTDHAFWLGASCLDKIIEFRSYGAQVSKEYRGINVDKILHLPYYPIMTSDTPFTGMPDVGEEIKVKIFSGAALYKFDGDNGEYFSLMKRVLDENSEVALFIAGDGNRTSFNKFISDNAFHNRVFMLGNRKDISEIFKHVDIYVGSYPITGGLMSQLAAESSVPIIQYTRQDLPINIIETLFPLKSNDVQLTFFDRECFYHELQKLIKDKEYRQKRASSLTNAIMNHVEFNKRFNMLIDDPSSIKFDGVGGYDINLDVLEGIYFDAASVQSANFMNRFASILPILLRNDFVFFVNVFFSIVFSKNNLLRIIKMVKNIK